MGWLGSRRLAAGAATIALTAAAGVAVGSTAHAAPPANDDIGGAVVIDALPFHFEQDTTEATTSPDEAAWNDFCGAPALEQGVWFTASVMSDASDVVVDVTGSDFSAGILVLVGPPDALSPVACQPGTVSGPIAGGQTIYLLIFGDGLSATSGNLVLDIYPAPPPPQVDLTIDPVGTFDNAGVAYVSGTVVCTSEDPSAILYDVSGDIRQSVGRFAIDGFFYVELFAPCDGVPQPWEAAVTGNGTFRGGKATITAFSYGCGVLACGEGFAEATVKLRGGG